MGNTESVDHDFDKFEGIDTLGYRVLGVQPDSPASQAGLVSFFDFLVGANGKILMGSGEGLQDGEEYDDVDFPALLQEFLNKPLELLVWNIKCQEKRLVTITPSNTWGGAGLLGVTIRLDDYGGADERLIRVLEVETNSPASIAGLVEEHDYLLGTAQDSFDSTATLSKVLHQHVDKVVELYVYNTESDVVRVVALMPTWSWGGNGLLGAEVGTGYLHRLPKSSLNTTGSSVERKVRWVGMKPKLPTDENDDKKNFGERTPTLEVEPQLEMEVVDSEAPSHDTHKTIQQVTKDSGNNGAKQMPSIYGALAEEATKTETKQDKTTERRQVVPESAMAAVQSMTNDEHGSEAQKADEATAESQSSQPPAPTETAAQREQERVTAAASAHPEEVPPAKEPTQEASTKPLQAPDAAAFFSAPPPASTFTASTPYASQFLPPPPKRAVDLR